MPFEKTTIDVCICENHPHDIKDSWEETCVDWGYWNPNREFNEKEFMWATAHSGRVCKSCKYYSFRRVSH